MRHLRGAPVLCLVLSLAIGVQAKEGDHWVATWGASQQLYRGPAGPARGPAPTPPPANPASSAGRGPQRRFPVPTGLPGLKDQTIRMVAHTTLGGSPVRIRLQNALGAQTVAIGSVHIAL